MPRLLLIFLLAKLCTSLPGQSLHAYHYGADEGLPSSEVYDIIQDAKGFIWIATDRGVSRYDGYTFTNFTSDDGLTDNTVFNLYEDDGRIWMMPFNGRICYYENGAIHPFPFNDALLNFMPPQRIVRSFAGDGHGGIYLGTMTRGVIHIDNKGSIMQQFTNDTIPTNVYEGKVLGQNFLFGYRVRPHPMPSPGLRRRVHFDLGTLDTTFYMKSSGGRLSMSGLRRRNGDCCISAMHTFTEGNGKTIRCIEDFPDEIIRLYEDRDSCLWIATDSNGVRRYGPNALPGEPFETYFPKEKISSIFEDREGGFWFGTLNNGIYYVPSLNVRMYFDDEKFRTKNVMGLSGNGSNRLFVGFLSEGVYSWNGSQFVPKVLNRYLGEKLGALEYDTVRHGLWIGMMRMGFLSDSGTSLEVNGLLNSAKDIAVGKDGTVYCGTYRDMVFYKSDSLQHVASYPVRQRIDAVIATHDGTVWGGNIDGLYKLQGQQLISAAENDSLLRTRISSFAELHDGTLVIATIGQGILLRNRAKPLNISIRQGLASNIVNDVATDATGNIWVASNQGVSCITMSGDTFTIRNYGLEHGLPSTEIRHITLMHDTLWLAGSTGVMRFCPGAESRNTVPPPVYIRQVHCGDSLLPDTGTVELSHRQNLLRFDFTGLSFRQRGHIRYRYRLIGLTDQWTMTTTPSVQFASLAPGHYRFELFAQNEDGVWSAVPASYSFVIHPPFWARWWFITLYILLIAGLIWLVMSLRLRQIRRRNALRVQAADYQQQLLAAQVNPHFIFNALNSIQSYLAVEDRRSAMKYLSRFARLMRLSLDQSRQKFVSLHDEIETLQLYLELEGMRFRERIFWSVDVALPGGLNGIQVPAMIIQPYVENAIRHGILAREDNAGKLEVKIYEENEQLICTVEDNGIGREAAARQARGGHRSSGMSITGERLRLVCESLGQQFVLEVIDKNDTEGRACGTIVKFALPYFRT